MPAPLSIPRTALALLFLLLASTATPAGASSASLTPWTAATAPPLALDDLSGVLRDLGREPGRVVLVHFFATWCEPCIPELAALDRFRIRADGQALTILAVSVGEGAPRLRRFFAERPAGFPVLLDGDRTAARAWQVETLPATFILDDRLGPRLAAQGDVDWDRVEPAALVAQVRAR